MDKVTLAVVLVVVLGYTQARPYYYPYPGYHIPWYPVHPCNPHPPTPCNPYSHPNASPCGGQSAPAPRPTPCNPEPAGPPNQPPPAYNQQAAEEALLTQDIKDVRLVRQGSRLPRLPRQYPKLRQQHHSNADEYRALKRKPLRRNRFGTGRQYAGGEHFGGYGRRMAPAVFRDQAEDMDDYEDGGGEYEDYDRGMGQGVYRDEGDYRQDEDDDGEDDY